jgi:hypothetical protein
MLAPNSSHIIMSHGKHATRHACHKTLTHHNALLPVPWECSQFACGTYCWCLMARSMLNKSVYMPICTQTIGLSVDN